VSTYNENMDSILRTFKSQWDATGIPVVYELTESDLKPHPRDTGSAWVRVVVRHNDAVQKSLPGPKGKTKYWRYGLVWIQLFVPAVSGASWTAAQDLAEVAQKAYEGKFDPNITYLKAAIEDKPRDNGWVRKDIKVFFHWDETEPLAAPPTPGNAFLTVPFNLGMAMNVTMTATITGEQDIAAANALGLAMAATVRREKDLSVADSLGLTMASPVKLEKDLSIADSLGLAMAATVRREKDLSVADSLGLAMASPVKLEKDLSATDSLGLAMAATVLREKYLSVADSLGLTMASPVKLEKDLSVADSLGLTMAAVIQLQKNLTVPIGLGLTESAAVSPLSLQMTFKQSASINTNASATFNFANQPIGSASADRWVFVTWAAKNSANLTLNSLTIGGVTATQEAIDGILAPAIGVTSIAFANVTAGTTADVVFTWSGAFNGTVNNGMGINVYVVYGQLDTVARDSLDDNSTTTPLTKSFAVPPGGVAFVTATANNSGSSVSGDFTVDRNGVAFSPNLFNYGLSVSNHNGGKGATDVFTATSFSSVGASCPKIGRAYGLTRTRITSDGNVRVTSDGTVRTIA
jgi:hypothetical protein